MGLALACKGAEAVGRTYFASAVAVRADGGRGCAIGAEVENVGSRGLLVIGSNRTRSCRGSSGDGGIRKDEDYEKAWLSLKDKVGQSNYEEDIFSWKTEEEIIVPLATNDIIKDISSYVRF